jgi:hypothetical protein
MTNDNGTNDKAITKIQVPDSIPGFEILGLDFEDGRDGWSGVVV